MVLITSSFLSEGFDICFNFAKSDINKANEELLDHIYAYSDDGLDPNRDGYEQMVTAIDD